MLNPDPSMPIPPSNMSQQPINVIQFGSVPYNQLINATLFKVYNLHSPPVPVPAPHMFSFSSEPFSQ